MEVLDLGKHALLNLISHQTDIEYSNDMDDIHKNIEEYNPNRKSKILIVFDDLIADMLSNKKLNPIVTKIFIRGNNWTFFLNLLHNFISLYRKILD